LIRLVTKDPFLSVSIAVLILLTAIQPDFVFQFSEFVHWDTIIALSGLLIITTAMEESGVFSRLARRMIYRLKNEKSLALWLVLLSAVFSTFLTNDITLFIMIPLTLSLQKYIKNDIEKLIIFEALAVNVGSLLTPIGNPQNIFLWHRWKISFPAFVYKMLPVEILTLSLLVIFTFIVFKKKPIIRKEKEESRKIDLSLFLFSILLLAVFIISIEKRASFYALIGIAIFYLVFFRKIVCKANWALILLFIVLFIDIHLISCIFPLKEIFTHPAVTTNTGIYLLSIVTSQILSNVPAAILISRFSDNWIAITYGVNIGGNGIVIASLANIIALKMGGTRGIWKRFHYYSLPFLLISTILVLILL